MTRSGPPFLHNTEQFAGRRGINQVSGNKNVGIVPRILKNLLCWNKIADPVPQMVENLLCWNKKAISVPKTAVDLPDGNKRTGFVPAGQGCLPPFPGTAPEARGTDGKRMIGSGMQMDAQCL